MRNSSWKPKTSPFVKYKREVFKKIGSVAGFVRQIGEFEELRQKSKEVKLTSIKSKEMKRKFDYLKMCLLKYRKATGVGRGMTAVQVGIAERFAVIVGPEGLMIIVNPKITKRSEKLLSFPEICMSAQPLIVPTIRPAWVEFDYWGEDGRLHHWNTKDDSETGRIMNRVFQHEIDHMEGIINVDKVKNTKLLILESDPKFYSGAKFEEVK